MLLPNKKTIDRAIADGTLPKIDRILSAAHLLTCIADHYMQEADDLTRGCGFCLGEVKRAQTAYSQHMERYNALWTQLVKGSHMTHERTEDFDRFMPAFTRMLGLEQLITDTNTGRPVSESPTPTADALAAEGKDGGSNFRVMRSDDCQRITYRAATLTEEQKKVLGHEVPLTTRTHSNIKHLIECYAQADHCTQRDIINEALVHYIEHHPPLNDNNTQQTINNNGNK